MALLFRELSKEGRRANRLIIALLGAAIASLFVSGCGSPVKVFTYIVNLTTDESPHSVQLNRQIPESGGYEPVLELRFPRTYFIYADNQYAYRQSIVGLSLDPATFQPLAKVIARSIGSEDPGALLRAYNGRQFEKLYIRLTAAPGQGTRPRSSYLADDVLGVAGPFTLYRPPSFRPAQAGCTNAIACPYGESVEGVTRAGPALHLHCEGHGLCSISFPYRGNNVDLIVAPRAVEHAVVLHSKILRLLDSHVVHEDKRD